MDAQHQPQRFGHHANAFGFLRLLFASLVIVSHASELLDGNRKRELLTSVFGTLSFGEVAVDGFFIVSGYLVSLSFLNSQSGGQFLLKRMLRIYPGFLLAFVVSIFVFGPIGGVHLSTLPFKVYKHLVRDGLLLQFADLPGAFAHAPIPLLNGAMWTIAYEFRCYLLVLLLGYAGLLRNRLFLGLAAAACLIVYAIGAHHAVQFWGGRIEATFGNSMETLRFTGCFLAGAFMAMRPGALIFPRRLIPLNAALLIAGMLSTWTATIAIATCGTYLVLATAFGFRDGPLQDVNNKTDISFGIYLYAWPITQALHLWFPTMGPVPIGLLTLLLSALAGTISWYLIEKPTLTFRRRFPRREGTTPLPT